MKTFMLILLVLAALPSTSFAEIECLGQEPKQSDQLREMLKSMKTAWAGSQSGVATFYADSFKGRLTKTEEVFDQNKLTAAMKSKAMHSIVTVTHEKTGQSVCVRINDTGNSRLIDLTTRAARAIGITKDMGIGRVIVEDGCKRSPSSSN